MFKLFMKPISNEKRELILSALSRGEKPETIALWLNVARSSVYNIHSLSKQSCTLFPKPFTGRRTILTEQQLLQIRELVELQPDITLEEIIQKLELPIKKSRLSVILIRMGFSFKKRHSIPKSSNEKMFKKDVQHGKKHKDI